MCDKEHYKKLEGRVEKLEKDYSTHAAVSNEQIKTLFNKEVCMADEAIEIYNKALELGLEMRQLPADEVRRIYNGVGAEWMGDELRAMLDKLSKTLLPAVLVHDMDYAYGNGKYIDFVEANIRLAANGRICADAEYRWYNPMRYIVRRQAKLFANLCDTFGLLAYHAAIQETEEHKNKENK